MSVLSWIENEWAKLKSSTVAQAAEADAEAIGGAAWAYIKTNGLNDLYQIAFTIVGAMVPGASWTATLASIEAQATTDGVSIAKGAIAVVAAQAQADLLSAGKAAGLPAATETPAPAAA